MINTKQIIGLTGNIATGKSVVRRMLANSGALGIDADDITHRLLYPGAPAYKTVLDVFGNQILSPEGEISRDKLGEIVFTEKEKLKILENLIHPWVTKAIKKRIQNSTTPIVVIEAIKLIESDLKELCDYIWVSHVSEKVQIERLQQTRKMNQTQAERRIAAQNPQSEKLDHADVVIHTEGSFKDTWESIQEALNDTIHTHLNEALPNFNNPQVWQQGAIQNLLNENIVSSWKKLTPFSTEQFYQYLGTHMVLLLYEDGQCSTFLLWSNQNFTASLEKVFPDMLSESRVSSVLDAFQNHAQRNQCEILLAPGQLISEKEICLVNHGYTRQAFNDLTYPAWQRALEIKTEESEAEIWVKLIDQPVEMITHLT